MLHMQDLVGSEWGPAYDINLRVFYALQGTISGWPGGWGGRGRGWGPMHASGTCSHGARAHTAWRPMRGPGSCLVAAGGVESWAALPGMR